MSSSRKDKHTQSRNSRIKPHHKESHYSSSSSCTRGSSSSSSDSEGHFKYRKNDYVRDYKIKQHISDGTFGRVLKVKQAGDTYAMKLVRRNHVESAKSECKILRYLNKRQPHGYLVELKDHFTHNGYFVMVFERLGPSLYDLLHKNRDKPMPIQLVRSIAKQLLRIIGYMHSQKLTHTDLKPENILFAKKQSLKRNQNGDKQDLYLPQNDRIKVIDLGGAIYDDECHDSIINTRQYRAPEVQLECCEWGHSSDVWGLGCIIAEMYTGSLLFQTRKNEFEHVALMQKMCGTFPQWMLKSTRGTIKPFIQVDEFNLRYYAWPQVFTTQESQDKVAQTQRLEDKIYHPELRDLLVRMLNVDPNQRITCSQALEHKFFSQNN